MTAVGPWSLRTSVDVGGRTRQLWYLHALGAGTPRGPYLHEHISFLMWLGVGQTGWDCLLEEGTAEAVEMLAQVCGHFVQAVPELVAGLSPPADPG